MLYTSRNPERAVFCSRHPLGVVKLVVAFGQNETSSVENKLLINITYTCLLNFYQTSRQILS